ncbi:CRISPR-associated helicase Cas3' [Streptomyces chrestomyceticus]|uniref:CRISPR-associated helicase Cas3' n=1 Tax=Streptomyces chrestomyceticus TaxID=68185 RepID=UPI0033C5ACE3
MEDGRSGGIDLSPWGKYSRRYGVTYSVLFHMLDVAAVAGELWGRLLAPAQRTVICEGLQMAAGPARRLVMFVAGCHDLGKMSRFQMCEPGAWARVSDPLRADTGRWRLMRHERASMHAAVEILAGFGYRLEGNDSPAVRVAQILGAHHGRFLQVDVAGAASDRRVRQDLGGPAWYRLRVRYAALVRHLTGATVAPARVPAAAAVLICGLVTVADRLASQVHLWLPRAMAPAFGAAEHYATTQQPAGPDATESWAAAVVSAAGLDRVTLAPVPFTQAHPQVPGPNVLQTSVIEQLEPAVAGRGPGILVCTDSTGAGKTIAALEAARIFNAHCGTRGITVLQPTTAIADAAYDTLTAYVEAHRPARAPVTVVHNHSWLSAAYPDDRLAGQEQTTLDEAFDAAHERTGRPESRVTVPAPFLRGWDQALLAPFAVATIDQALMAVLSVRFEALRMLALCGRTIIIDEAHDYTPYMQHLLERLLHWLGACRTPVVILSATLPAGVAQALVRAYLAGAGHPRRRLAEAAFPLAYPGWLYAAARDATCTEMDAARRTVHAHEQRRTVTVHLRPVRYRRSGGPQRSVAPDERLAQIGAEIALVVAAGGCAVVVCATVADAQDTYLYLRHTLTWTDPRRELVLLHARFPGLQREPLTRRVRTWLGPRGPRPQRLVVVTTSLLDMSLDIDADLMISDLASLARLLQRLGRLWRCEKTWHERGGPAGHPRPAWIRRRGPRLTVLHPVDENDATALPPAWQAGEPVTVLEATAALLQRVPKRTVTLPDQVPPLLAELDADLGVPPPAQPTAVQTAHQARSQAECHLAASQVIPPPGRIGSLADLYRRPATAGQAPTRAGERPRRLLPCYRQPSGTLSLDRAGARALPDRERLRPHEVRAVLERTVAVPEDWVSDSAGCPPVPPSWARHPLLADLTLLAHTPHRPEPVRLGRHLLHLDAELGLVHDQAP